MVEYIVATGAVLFFSLFVFVALGAGLEAFKQVLNSDTWVGAIASFAMGLMLFLGAAFMVGLDCAIVGNGMVIPR